MFDPKVILSDRLANECGLKSDASFYPKRDADEEELKYLVSGGFKTFEKIRSAIQSKPNRIVDTDNWTSNPYALVTLNLDTQDQSIHRAGYSLRVRFSLRTQAGSFLVSRIDMCIKTLMSGEKTSFLKNTVRGEWEAELESIAPKLSEMIRQNARSNPPLPEFFKDNHIRDEDLFVESTGCTLRHIFPSFEIIKRKKKVFVPVFQHTEDVLNLFLNPRGDTITSEDSEAEAEFLGIFGMDECNTDAQTFLKHKKKSKELLDGVIVSESPGDITRNLISKAIRARNGLEQIYAPHNVGRLNITDFGQAVEEASRFALSQRVRPEDMNLKLAWHYIEKMRNVVERQKSSGPESTFDFKKR